MPSSPGSLDPNFGNGGLVSTSFGGAYDSPTTVLTQPDGKIVAVGTDYTANFATSQIALVRYNKDGSLDTSFGSGGKVLTLLGPTDYVMGAVIQPDGKIDVDAIEETSPNSGQYENLLVQYNSDGTLDTSFGNGGSVVTPGFEASPQGNPIIVTPQGQIVVVGSSSSFTNNPPMEVAEFNGNGTLNQNFGSGGIATFAYVLGMPTQSVPSGVYAPIGRSVAVDQQGRILVGGEVEQFGTTYSAGAALFRLNPDGTLDKTFGYNGSVTNVYGLDGETVTGLALRPDGEIVAAGQAGDAINFGQVDFAVEQFNPDGTPDLSFGSGGVVTTALNENIYATGVALQPSGDVVVAGYTQSFSNGSFTQGMAMTRYTPNGNPDSTFGTGGIVTTFFPNGSGSNLALEPDSNIVVAGTVTDPVTGNADFGVAEYLGKPFAPADASLAAGLASPSGAIPGRPDGRLGIGGVAIAQPPTASSSVSQTNTPTPPTSSAQSTAAGLPVTSRSGTRTDSFFTLLSGAIKHTPSNQDGSFLDGMDALLPAAQSSSLPAVGSTFATSKPVPSPALSSSPTATFNAALSEVLSHAVGMPDSGGADVPDPSALDALFASTDVLERSMLNALFASPG